MEALHTLSKFEQTRKTLPSFGVLKNIQFDIDEVRNYFEKNNLFDFNQYNDIKFSHGASIAKYIQLYSPGKMGFFTEQGAPYLEGDQYRQIYLTELDPNIHGYPTDDNLKNSPGGRMRRLDPSKPEYNPYVDELNFNHPTKHVKGIIKQIMDSFQDRLTRVRLAYMAPGFCVKPHVDHDPSYIVRYHIPIQSNPNCNMHIYRDKKSLRCHFPADGRVYFLNAGLKHWATNHSDQWRLHMIVDVHGQEALKNLEEIKGEEVPN